MATLASPISSQDDPNLAALMHELGLDYSFPGRSLPPALAMSGKEGPLFTPQDVLGGQDAGSR